MVLLATGLLLERLVKVMSAYVAATIVGGLCSRLVAGYVLEIQRWEWLFFGISVGLVLVSVVAFRSSAEQVLAPVLSSKNNKPNVFSLSGILMVFRHPVTRFRLLSVACLFFVFSGMLNYATFRIYEISDSVDQLSVGLLYVGYVLGLFVSLSAQALSQRLGGTNRVSTIAYVVFFLAVAVTMVHSEWVLYCALFVFCGAMFLVHSLATAATNALATDADDRRLLNASYLSFYYGGGVLGSYLPGLIYQYLGWVAFVIGLMSVTILGWWCLTQSIRSEVLLKSHRGVFSVP
jgi:YNFM family putative membrane transporter